MNTFAVIGAGFGDEGKGAVVNYLCQKYKSVLVSRFCGGHQAGHHVVLRDGRDHVFSNFGSGSFHSAPTLWSKYCTIDPQGIINEKLVLAHKNINPLLYISSECAITTPFEKVLNYSSNKNNKHGSCGVGYGATIEREENFYSLKAIDLLYWNIFTEKFRLIENYYKNKYNIVIDKNLKLNFINHCQTLLKEKNIKIVTSPKEQITEEFNSIIYEGSQGLLLDQHFGFFPHVTRSNTGTKNLIKNDIKSHIFLVTRAYQTRHGNGFMSSEESTHIKKNPYEQNFDDSIQGKFRKGILDLDLLKYGIEQDGYIQQIENKTLVITCLDLIDKYIVKYNNEATASFGNERIFVEFIANCLGFKNVLLSRNPFSEFEEFKI